MWLKEPVLHSPIGSDRERQNEDLEAVETAEDLEQNEDLKSNDC